MRVTISSVDGQVLDTFSLSSYISFHKGRQKKKKNWLGVIPFLKNKEKEKSASILSTFLKVEEGRRHFYWHDCMK
jgi:hypothetical protein